MTAPADTKLLVVASPIADVSEIHEMTMQNDVKRMHQIPGVDLPAGKAVELKSGSDHIMLMLLEAPATAGTSVHRN